MYQEKKIYQINKSELEEFVRRLSRNDIWTITAAYPSLTSKSKSIRLTDCIAIEDADLHINQMKSLRDNNINNDNNLSYKKHNISYPALKQLMHLFLSDKGYPNGEWEIIL